MLGTLPPSSADPTSGRRLEGRVLGGRYLVGQMLGSGAMGHVHRAKHIELGRLCAVKVIREPRGGEDACGRELDEAIARFRVEAVAASRLDHANVLRVLDFGREPNDGVWFLVTEHLDGTDLVDVLGAEAPLALERIVTIARQICSALAHAHDRGVVHRDVKPENVRLVRGEDERGVPVEHAKLLDFGTAQIGDLPSQEIDRMVIGTPAYMSPEQASGEPVDGRSDVYACGVLLFEMATGRLPFERPSAIAIAAAQVECPAPSPSDFNPEIDPDLERIIARCLSKRPQDRLQSARELRDALDRICPHLDLKKTRDGITRIEGPAVAELEAGPRVGGHGALAVDAVERIATDFVARPATPARRARPPRRRRRRRAGRRAWLRAGSAIGPQDSGFMAAGVVPGARANVTPSAAPTATSFVAESNAGGAAQSSSEAPPTAPAEADRSPPGAPPEATARVDVATPSSGDGANAAAEAQSTRARRGPARVDASGARGRVGSVKVDAADHAVANATQDGPPRVGGDTKAAADSKAGDAKVSTADASQTAVDAKTPLDQPSNGAASGSETPKTLRPSKGGAASDDGPTAEPPKKIDLEPSHSGASLAPTKDAPSIGLGAETSLGAVAHPLDRIEVA